MRFLATIKQGKKVVFHCQNSRKSSSKRLTESYNQRKPYHHLSCAADISWECVFKVPNKHTVHKYEIYSNTGTKWKNTFFHSEKR